jgi:hypothetical protein
MSGVIGIDILTIAIAIASGWRIICVGKDAKLHEWRGSRERFLMLSLPYALMFVAMLALLIDAPFARSLAVVTMAAWLFVRRNPFERE